MRQYLCDGVKPEPEGNSHYESNGYNDVSELDHNIFDVVVELEGHRGWHDDHASSMLKTRKSAPSTFDESR